MKRAPSGKQLSELAQGLLIFVKGDEKTSAQTISSSENIQPGSVVFLSDAKNLSPALQAASIIIVSEKLAGKLAPDQWELPRPQTQVLYKTTNVKKAMALVLAAFDLPGTFPAPGVHTTAFVHPSAKLGKNVIVEAQACIMADAVVGDGCWIQSGAVIESHAKVGAGSRVQSRAVIGSHCELGSHCRIGSGTVIGSDGFGFVESRTEAPIKVPQIGNVIIGDHVEFGANCAVDRATIGSTVIGSSCKFDNLCHVAHNCVIGKNGLFAGGFFIAGSSSIGDHFMCGGNAVIADHIAITDSVILGGRSSVTNDITEPGAYTGYPLEKLKDGLRTLASLPRIKELRESVHEIKKKLDMN